MVISFCMNFNLIKLNYHNFTLPVSDTLFILTNHENSTKFKFSSAFFYILMQILNIHSKYYFRSLIFERQLFFHSKFKQFSIFFLSSALQPKLGANMQNKIKPISLNFWLIPCNNFHIIKHYGKLWLLI